MFEDLFITEDDLLNTNNTQIQTYTSYKGKNCSQYLDLPTLKRENNKFVGLKNQGATCYLNSLIQAYYMSPEFREAILALQLCVKKILSLINIII